MNSSRGFYAGRRGVYAVHNFVCLERNSQVDKGPLFFISGGGGQQKQAGVNVGTVRRQAAQNVPHKEIY
jgi:hypothetical protein